MPEVPADVESEGSEEETMITVTRAHELPKLNYEQRIAQIDRMLHIRRVLKELNPNDDPRFDRQASGAGYYARA